MKSLSTHAYTGSAKTEQDNSLEPVLQTLAAKYAVSEGQVLLKWALQHGYPILPKSLKKERIAENCNLFHFELSVEDLAVCVCVCLVS